MMYNSLTAYINVNDLPKNVFERIMKKVGCEYSVHDVDDELYYKFTYKRKNNLMFDIGTFAKLDFSGITMENADFVVEQLIEAVDKMKVPDKIIKIINNSN